MNDVDHNALLAELDAILVEAGPELEQDLGGELMALVAEHRESRATERPGAKGGE